MNRIERDGEGFVIPAVLLAEAFRMTEDDVRLPCARALSPHFAKRGRAKMRGAGG